MELANIFNSKEKMTIERIQYYKDIIHPVKYMHIKEENNKVIINTESKIDKHIDKNHIIILNIELSYATPKVDNKCVVIRNAEVYKNGDTNEYLLIAKKIEIVNVPDTIII